MPGHGRWMIGPRSGFRLSALLFVALVAVYNADRTAMEEGDAVPNMNLPLALIHHGTFSFTPDDYPAMFAWQSRPPLWETEEFYVRSWDSPIGDRPASKWRQQGDLTLHGPRYHLVRSPTRGVYVNTFGPVPGLTLFPLVWLLDKLDPAFGTKFELGLAVAKLHASMLVAASAVLLYWMARRFASEKGSLAVALTFGLGTCAWAIASQNLWQQTVSIFFLCAGALPLIRWPERSLPTALSGLAFGVAIACRPTSLVLVLAVGVYRALYLRKTVAPFVLGLLPAPLAIGAYNAHFFGNPFTFAQSVIGHQMAKAKTGSDALWQTPFYVGLAGLLASPSRGLLIFSPVIAFAGKGVVTIWRDRRYLVLRPLTVGMAWMMFVQCLWFDWWGGWAYGYRPWLDATPIIALCLAPVIDDVFRTKWQRAAFAAAFAWSVGVQFVGAFSYDKSWNDREIFVVRLPGARKPFAILNEPEARSFAKTNHGTYLGPSFCNIDYSYCRSRLWSVRDSMLIYYVTHFRQTRRERFHLAWRQLSLFRHAARS